MIRSLGVASLALLILSTPWAYIAAGGQEAQPGRVTIDVSKLGPQVGQPVPDFSLRDHTGRVRNLQSIMGPRGAMLVFMRSADW